MSYPGTEDKYSTQSPGKNEIGRCIKLAGKQMKTQGTDETRNILPLR